MPNVALDVPGGHEIGAEDPLFITSANQVGVGVEIDMGGGRAVGQCFIVSVVC